MEGRTPAMQRFIDGLALNLGVSPEFQQASDHPYTCTCDICREGWREMGPDEDGTYGPFGVSLDDTEEPAKCP